MKMTYILYVFKMVANCQWAKRWKDICVSIQYDTNTVGISDMLLYNFPETKYLNK